MKCVVNGIDRLFPEDDNVSVNFKPDHQPERRPRIRTFSLPGGSLDFESEKFSTVFKDKWRNFSICFKEAGGQLEKQVFLCCFMSTFAKTVMSTVSLIT